MEDKNKDKIEIIGKNGQKIEITEAEQERRAKIKKVNDEFKLVNAEKSRIINEKEIWKYFFEKPKKNYNKYMYEMLEFPKHLMYNNKSVDEYRGKWNEFFGNKNDILIILSFLFSLFVPFIFPKRLFYSQILYYFGTFYNVQS